MLFHTNEGSFARATRRERESGFLRKKKKKKKMAATRKRFFSILVNAVTRQTLTPSSLFRAEITRKNIKFLTSSRLKLQIDWVVAMK